MQAVGVDLAGAADDLQKVVEGGAGDVLDADGQAGAADQDREEVGASGTRALT